MKNFRIFGNGNAACSIDFEPGLTLLAGPNDGGKTAIIDAIRLVVGTTSRDFSRLDEDDFHRGNDGVRATTLEIVCRFAFASLDEAAVFYEFVTDIAGKPVLTLTLRATLNENSGRRVSFEVFSGPDGDGPKLDSTSREFVSATYLRALRDALQELTAGRGSRLSQILLAHPKFRSQGVATIAAATDDAAVADLSLVDIMRRAESDIDKNQAIAWVRENINAKYLLELSLASDVVTGEIGITRRATLKDILEKLDLWISAIGSETYRAKRGLGTNNILYMASELLLTSESAAESLPLLLIEEPEAHLHPQFQLLLGDYLQKRSAATEAINKAPAKASHDTTAADAASPTATVPTDSSTADDEAQTAPLQIIATTHSPILASQVDLERIIVVTKGRAFPLRHAETKLDETDYRFLSKFLDATRANLFFANSVIIVEGDAENLLLPGIANLIGRPLNKYGVSIVKVGTIGLFRYSRIFQSSTGSERIPIRVACITDLDLKPDATEAQREARRKARSKNDGGTVKTFVSPIKTLEFDLIAGNFTKEMNLAIALASASKSREENVAIEDDAVNASAVKNLAALALSLGDDRFAIAASIYKALADKTASKTEVALYFGALLQRDFDAGTLDAAELRARLPAYLVDALDYVTFADSPDEASQPATT